MTKEMKTLIKRYVKYCSIILIIVLLVSFIFIGINKLLFLLTGFLVSLISFILTGIMLDKVLVQSKRGAILILPIKLTLLLIVFYLVFKTPMYSSFFIIGFIIPLIISIFSLIKLQRKDV